MTASSRTAFWSPRRRRTRSLPRARATRGAWSSRRFSTASASTSRTSRSSRCVPSGPCPPARRACSPPASGPCAQDYQRQVAASGIITQDQIHNLFLNLNSLADFQRRFLIGVEANASLPPEQQHFGHLFITMVARSSTARARHSLILRPARCRRTTFPSTSLIAPTSPLRRNSPSARTRP